MSPIRRLGRCSGSRRCPRGCNRDRSSSRGSCGCAGRRVGDLGAGCCPRRRAGGGIGDLSSGGSPCRRAGGGIGDARPGRSPCLGGCSAGSIGRADGAAADNSIQDKAGR